MFSQGANNLTPTKLAKYSFCLLLKIYYFWGVLHQPKLT